MLSEGRTRVSYLSLTLLCCTLAAPVAGAAQTAPFEGVIVRQDSSDGHATTSRWLFRGGRMRVENDSSITIIDPRTRRMTLLLPSARAYVEIDIPPGEASNEAAPRIQRTGRRETIAGISCEHWTVTEDDDETTDACVASGLNVWPYLETFMEEGGKTDFIRSLARNGFYPLSERHSGRDAVDVVTSVSRTAPDAALFTVPAGYRRLTMEEYAREMMRQRP